MSRLELFVSAPEQHFGFTDKRQVSIFEGDPLLFWRLRPGLDRVVWDFTVVSTNAQGLRHPRPVGRKPPGAFRIVCLGDSVTFGYRVPLVHPDRPTVYDAREQPYPRLIEDRLRAANPGREVEVIALAVPGYSSHQGLAWIRHAIADLEPDLVTACFGWNDVAMRADTDRATMPADAARVALREAAGHSQLVAHAAVWLRGRGQGPAAPRVVPRVPVEDYVANHLAIAELARRHRAAAAVIGPVYRDAVTFPDEAARLAVHRRALRRAMEERGVPYLEIAELTEASHPANAFLFGELIHPNGEGHRVFAGALLGFLAERGLLGGLAVSTR